MLLTLDPGIRGCGLAVFFNRQLHEALYIPNPMRKGGDLAAVVSMAGELVDHVAYKWGNAPGPITIVVERPQIYRDAKQKGDPNDLPPLYAIAGALTAALGERGPIEAMHEYLPREWKGTLDPEEMARRVRERLSEGEFGKVQLPSNTCDNCRKRLTDDDCCKTTCLAHNVFDAIGIGLKFLTRLEPVRIIAR